MKTLVRIPEQFQVAGLDSGRWMLLDETGAHAVSEVFAHYLFVSGLAWIAHSVDVRDTLEYLSLAGVRKAGFDTLAGRSDQLPQRWSGALAR